MGIATSTSIPATTSSIWSTSIVTRRTSAKLQYLDLGNGNYPVVLEERGKYGPNDPRGDTLSLEFEEVDEDQNGNGKLDYPERDDDQDGELDAERGQKRQRLPRSARGHRRRRRARRAQLSARPRSCTATIWPVAPTR